MPEDSSDIISRLAPAAAGVTPAAGTLHLDSTVAGPGSDLTVTPSVLRGAAGAAHTIAGTLTVPNERAAADTRDAASALKGWRFGSLLMAAAESWRAEYKSVSRQVDLTGSVIADAARGFEWTEDRILSTFESNES